MRWFVEISSLGTKSGPSTTLCVDAPQWKHALQKARAARGDNGAMSNFSIDLLDDGYRAVDPVGRLRYEVRRAPDDAALTASVPPPAVAPKEDPKPAAKEAPVAKDAKDAKRALAETVAYTSTGAAQIVEAKPEPQKPAPAAGSKPTSPSSAAREALGTTVAFASSGTALLREEPAAEPVKSFKEALGTTVAFGSPGVAVLRDEPAKPAAKEEAKPAAKEPAKEAPKPAAKEEPKPAAKEPAKEAPKPAAKEEPKPAAKEPAKEAPAKDAAKPALPAFVVVGSREENPTEASPLTYREMVYAVAPGTSEDDARRVILDRFENVRAGLDAGRMGKLVNLAVFDHVFQGRPQRRPLVTLTWKDWKAGEPELRYPAREGDAPRSSVPATIKQEPVKAEPAKVEPAKPIVPVKAAEPVKVAEPVKAAEPTPVASTLSSAKPVALPKPAPEPAVPVVSAKGEPVKAEPAKPEPPKSVKVDEAAVVALPVKSIGSEPESAAPTRPIPTVASPATQPAADEEEIDLEDDATAPPAAAKAEPAKAEPAKPEAAKVEPAKAEPAKPEAAKVEPAKVGAAKVEPAKPEPAKAEPAKSEPAKPAAAKAEPAKAEPAKAEPTKPVVAKVEPTKPVVPKAEPAKPAAAKVEPAKSSKPATPPGKPKPTPVAARSASEPPSGPVSKRLSGDDLITELFEAFGDLHFLRDALEGAEFVLALTMEKLPSEVALVSFFDMGKREFVVARQHGGAKSVLCARQPERAQLAFQAMRKRHAIVVAEKTEVAQAMDDRFRALGVELKSLVVAPVELGGRFLGLIEIGNPLDGHAYNEGDGNALTYIGQQFAEFVAERGVIVDPEHIREVKGSTPPPAPEKAPRSAAASSKKTR